MPVLSFCVNFTIGLGTGVLYTIEGDQYLHGGIGMARTLFYLDTTYHKTKQVWSMK